MDLGEGFFFFVVSISSLVQPWGIKSGIRLNEFNNVRITPDSVKGNYEKN